MANDDILLMLKQIEVFLQHSGDEITGDKEMTFAQAAMLYELLLIEKERTPYSSYIQEKTGFSRAYISDALKRLKTNGYITMNADPRDKRKRYILLTSKGYDSEQKVYDIIKNLSDRLCKGISEKELSCTKKTLQAMLTNMRKGHEKTD